MTERADTVVVGGRVAGASLGIWLARGGQRVVVLEAAALGTDQVFSTHSIQPPGVLHLTDLGVLDELLEHTPWVTRNRIQIGEAAASNRLTGSTRLLNPRRHVLDGALQRRAIATGVDVRPHCKAEELLTDGERVVGVRYRTPEGARAELRASAVVGADGRRSTVARLVGAEPYVAKRTERVGYWLYADLPPVMASGEYDYGVHAGFHGDVVVCVFHCGHDEVLLGAQMSEAHQRAYADPIESLRAAFERHPNSAPLFEGLSPRSKVRHLPKLDVFYRAASGPGWALVGDAALHKDSTPGLGITDALRDAEALSSALLEGGDAPLERYWHTRDELSLPLFDMADDMGDPSYVNSFSEMVVQRLSEKPELSRRLVEVSTRVRAADKLITHGEALRWCARAGLRDRSVWSGLARAVKRVRQLKLWRAQMRRDRERILRARSS